MNHSDAEEKYEIVYRSHNPVEAEMLDDVLGQEGYEPHLIGTRTAALIGAPDTIFALRIEVPQRFAEDARRLVEEILAPTDFGDDEDVIAQAEEGEEEEEEGGDEKREDGVAKDPDGPKVAARKMGKKSHVIAAGIVFVFPGAGHYYAGRVVTGCFISAIMVAAFAALLIDEIPTAGTTLLMGALLLDIIGSQVAIARHNAGGRTTKGRQLLLGLVYILGLAGLSALFQAVIPEPDRSSPWEYQTIDWNQAPLPRDDLPFPLEINLEMDTDAPLSEEDLEEMMRLLHRREIDGLMPPVQGGEGE